MNRKLFAVASVTALLLTGCGTATTPPTETEPPAPAPSSNGPAQSESPQASVPSATLKLNDRGQLPKKVGQQAGAGEGLDNLSFKMKVTGFDFVKCDGTYAQEMDGHVLAVSVEMQTTKDFEGSDGYNNHDGVMLTDYSHWVGYEPDGTKMNSLDGSDGIQNCFDDGRKLFPDYIDKGEKAKGQILLNVTTKSGEVAFDPYGFGGWVWKYPNSKATA